MTVLRILVSATDKKTAEELAGLSRAAGFEVVAKAFSAKEAVTLAADLQPDLVLADAGPGFGSDTSAAIETLQGTCGIPVILSAASDAKIPERSGKIAPAGCIARPCGPHLFGQVAGAVAAARVPAGDAGKGDQDKEIHAVAHDINNALSSALANIQICRRSCAGNTSVCRYLDSAEESILRARDQSCRLLAPRFSKRRRGEKFPVQKEHTRPRAEGGRKAKAAPKYRILLMDDEEAILSATSEMLTFLGHEVIVAENGDVATSLYKKAQGSKAPFDAVILDVTVPGGKGAEHTLPQLRELDPAVKVIVSSGYATHPLVTGFATNGFNAALIKPYGFKELEESLARVFLQ